MLREYICLVSQVLGRFPVKRGALVFVAKLEVGIFTFPTPPSGMSVPCEDGI